MRENSGAPGWWRSGRLSEKGAAWFPAGERGERGLGHMLSRVTRHEKRQERTREYSGHRRIRLDVYAMNRLLLLLWVIRSNHSYACVPARQNCPQLLGGDALRPASSSSLHAHEVQACLVSLDSKARRQTHMKVIIFLSSMHQVDSAVTLSWSSRSSSTS